MSGSGGVSVTRAIRDENRFYHPPPIRRLHQQERERQIQEEKNRRKKLQQEEEIDKKNRRNGFKMRNKKNKRLTGSNETKSSDCSISGRLGFEASNLDRFLEYTTPVVPAQPFTRPTKQDPRTSRPESQPHYVLGDLWDSFMEWSAYGVGVPLLLAGDNSVVQYYVPYLSAIQLFVDTSKNGKQQRRHGEDSDADSFRETSSDGSSDCAPQTCQNGSDVNARNLGGLSLNDKSVVGSSSDESEACNPTGQWVFEYFEHEPPFSREPLADKISKLAIGFPELFTFKSCNLSSSSWFSVAWYPIYRIPVGPTLQNLDACFLTFHSLTTPMQGRGCDGSPFHLSHVMESEGGRACNLSRMALPAFGLASYKFKAAVWNLGGTQEDQRVKSLGQAAEKWLRGLQIYNHPDYSFFISHSPQSR